MSSTYSFTITSGDGETPVSTDARKTALLMRNVFHNLSGHNIQGNWTVKARTAGVYASGTATCATVTNAQTVTVNGTAFTATQRNARGTVTAASASVADTVTVNGVVFTAAAAQNLTTGAFDQSGTDTATATSLAACINASVDPLVAGLVTAASAAAIVTIRAVAAGTGGNSLTLATSNNTRLAKSGTTLSGGSAIANNTFDFGGTNTQTAAALAAAINASSTALVNTHVTATSALGVVTLTAVYPGYPGNAVTLVSSDGTTLAVTGTGRLTGGTETLTTFTY